MRCLIIDTTTSWCSVCLIENRTVLDYSHQNLGRGHAEHLLPHIAALPNGGICDEIWVNIGPGSFTGVRIGISAAKGLALAWGVPCKGYGALTALSSAGRAASPDIAAARHNVAISGGHGEYFTQQFDVWGAAVCRTLSLNLSDACAQLNEPWVIGDAAEPIVAARGWGKSVNIGADARNALHLDAQHFSPDITPDYARAPDAKVKI
jgi:tRNA threonylcarbamoyladenosine biosynthesis protein TsaB